MSLEWLPVEWLSAERLVAAAALGQLAVLIFAARYARNQVEEARRLREAGQQLQEAEARPYVMLDFELGDRPPFINLVVANLGKTMARNVRIEVDPSFESSLDAKVPVPVGKLKLFTEGIPIPSAGQADRAPFRGFASAPEGAADRLPGDVAVRRRARPAPGR